MKISYRKTLVWKNINQIEIEKEFIIYFSRS